MDDHRRMLAEAAELERRGHFREAAELMLSVLCAAAAPGAAHGTPLDLRTLRLETARVLECAEAAHGWEEMAPSKALEADDFVAVREDVEEHVPSPMEQWLRLHPPPPPPPLKQLTVPEAPDEFVVVQAAPSDWIIVDDTGVEGTVSRALPRGCLECGARKGLLPDATCVDCGGQYCGAHGQLLEGGSRCVDCALLNEQCVGASRVHAEKFVFCRRIFSARAAAQLQLVRSRVAGAALPAAVAASTSFQLLSMAPSWSQRVLCHVCSAVTAAAQSCRLCTERCCPQCMRPALRIDDVDLFCGRASQEEGAVAAAGALSGAVVVERSCSACHSLVVRHTRTLARISARQPTRAHGEMMAVYDRLRAVMDAIGGRLVQLELQLSLWQQSTGAAHYRDQCAALARELDAHFVQLAGGAKWLRDHKGDGGRLIVIIGAAVAEFYGDTSQRLRWCQDEMKRM